MTTALRRYEFSERLAEILGESRRDLRSRVTLLVSGGLIPPGPRGPGSPPATPDYAAELLIGVLAAPQQVHTVDAVRCYRELTPAPLGRDSGAGISLGVQPRRILPPLACALPVAWASDRFGEALARLIDHARVPETRAWLREGLFGIWLSRGFPAASIQLAAARTTNPVAGRRSVVSRRYELPPGARPPAWLDPDRGGSADPGLFHSVFLPVSKLIEIGTLTAPIQKAAIQTEGLPAVIDLRQKIADLASLAHQARDRRPWEKFLAAAAVAEDLAEHVNDRDRGLVEVTGFGANPGGLRMLTHVPDILGPKPALVVVLHGCTQTAASYDTGTGWSTLADRHGFALLLPEQRRRNNPLRCFNWFRSEDNQRDSGEAASIRQMVERMIADHGIDPSRVYVTGLSAGGAMTSVLLATYPDVFAGGAILSAVPYRSAEGLQDAFEVIFQGRSLPAAEWGARVRAASDHPGPWPTVSVWHGDSDATVTPINQTEIVKQWLDVHGLPSPHSHEETVNGHTRRVWRNAEGREVIESWSIAGMGHGAAIDPAGADGCGVAGPFINDVGLSSSFQIARSWGLTETRREVPERPRRSAQGYAARSRGEPRWASLVERARSSDNSADIPIRETSDLPSAPSAGGRVIRIDTHGKARLADREAPKQQGSHAEKEANDTRRKGSEAGASSGLGGNPGGSPGALGIDVHAIITKSFEAAGLLKSDPARPSGGSGPLGIDIPGIISTSLEAAGVLKGSRSPGGGTPGARAPGGIDLQDILTRSFEAAGLLRTPPAPPRETRGAPPAEPAPETGPAPEAGSVPEVEPACEAVAPETPAAPVPAADENAAGSVNPAPLWEGDGWRLDAGESEGAPAVLHGCASAGDNGEVGRTVRSVDCRVMLGDNPTLSYVRKVQLQADPNMFTTATFSVLVDGEPVDEASAAGMDYAEADWTERSGIDLSRFAGREVTLTFQVMAHANVFQEVFAKAWVREIVISDADAAASAAVM